MNRIVSLGRLVVGFIALMLISVVVLAVLPLLLPWRVLRIKWCNIYGKVAGRTIVFLAGVKPVIHNEPGLNGSMPAIYVCNHNSTLDAFLCVWLCPIGASGVFKKEIVYVPFYGWVAYLSGHLLIDRANSGKAIESMRRTAEFVKKNRLGMWIMPEGTRSRDGALLPFKKGFVHLAIASGLPVVPVIVHGAYKNWEAKTFQFHPMTLHIDVLPPIDTSGWKEENAAQHAESVRDLFVTALQARGTEV